MNKAKIKYSDFETYLPEREFDERQIEFFKDTFENITTNKDTSKVTCFCGRCGIGKSTFINTFMHSCIGDFAYNVRHEPQGLIIITDRIKRLEELSYSNKHEAKDYWGELFEGFGVDEHYKEFEAQVIVLKSSESFKEQLIEQHYKPILLISTQRYFMLSDEMKEHFFTFNHNGKKLKRDIIIFDEAPIFFETITIDSDNLSKIESALYKGLSEQVDEKDFMIKEYKAFKDRLLDLLREKEKSNKDTNVILYWKDTDCNSVTRNDDLFFKTVSKNMESLSKQYSNFMKDLMCLKEMAENGAIVHTTKKKHGTYDCSFRAVIDNRRHFYLGEDKKFFVFDATADIDPHYNLDYVEIVDGEKYNKNLKMTITNVKVKTSKNVLCKNSKQSNFTTDVISEYLKEKLDNQNDILIVVYSDLQKRFEKEFSNVAYFGNLKGFNDFKDLNKMAHIGMNRFPNLEYFYIYCGCHMDVYRNLVNMTEEESMRFFDSINRYENKEYKEELTDIMLRCMLTDFEQNIFRLSIRNFKNNVSVYVWTFYNSDNDVYSKLSELLEWRYSKYGVAFEYEDTPRKLKTEKIKDRKPPNGKDMTNSQKVLNWLDEREKGSIFKLNKLLSETGLTNDSFNEIKKSNTTIKELFKEMRTDKKGYYKVS